MYNLIFEKIALESFNKLESQIKERIFAEEQGFQLGEVNFG